MTDSIGYWLSGQIALGIILIGARFFLIPHADRRSIWRLC
jgi:hypothetical protein